MSDLPVASEALGESPVRCSTSQSQPDAAGQWPLRRFDAKFSN